jgi:NADH oxidase (H2O2-forming)
MEFEFDIVVIGGGGAGVTAATEALKFQPSLKVLLVSEEEHIAYPRCDLPYLIFEGEEKIQGIIMDAVYEKQKNLTIKKGASASEINTDDKTVVVKDLTGGGEESFGYRSLVIATGSRAIKPPIPGLENKGVFALRTLKDLHDIRARIKKTKDCVLIGAGAIGIELAEILTEGGINTTVVEALPQVLPRMLDPDMASMVEDLLRENKVKVITGKYVTSINGHEGEVESVSVGDEEIPAEMVIVATGTRPNTDVVKGTDINLGPTGGIKTNNRLETNIKGIYAAGDCAETFHLITKEPMVSFLGSSANKQGKIAGINAAGGNLYYDGAFTPAILKVFDFEVGSVGLTQTDAKMRNYPSVFAKVSQYDRPLFTPSDRKSTVKMIADPDGRIIGCQIIGEKVAPKIDQIAVGIYKGLTTKELMLYESAYAPIVSQTLTSITLAADIIQKKIERMKKRG